MELVDFVKNLSDSECKVILKRIAEHFNKYPSYLSYKSDYAKGYKDAWYLAYDNLHALIKN